MHAFAGSGKTATAAEFARWYALTGGLDGPVLFSSFERHLPLARALDKIGEIFGPMLERSGVPWGALDDKQRRDVALDKLKQIPVLWIWDNVEPITGFPAGTPSDWSAAEQQELRDFLLEARETKAKFLLTSRRDEQAWLGELPVRVKTPPMPMQERLQLAGAIAKHRGRRFADLPDLTPLLQFTRGNPLTILVTVGEALRCGIDNKEKLDDFVAGLRAGEGNFEDEEAEGRTKSLGASLSYGFATAFNDAERKRLALLHLFHGFIEVGVLRPMGNPKAGWALDEVLGLTPEQAIDLLDRSAEIGLLIRHGGDYYGVHPALPWYFRDLFARHFAGEKAQQARRAFVEAMGLLGDHYCNQYDAGNRQVLHLLTAEEGNLLAAWRLARQFGWWRAVISAMQGLPTLYRETGRGPAWRRLVDAVTPDLVDSQTDRPLPGREGQWSFVTEYRVQAAREKRDLGKAEHLQRLCLDWGRESARAALATAPERRSDSQRNDIRSLAVCIQGLAEIQRDKGDVSCTENLREAFDLYGAIGALSEQGNCAFQLGRAYSEVATCLDLDLAEQWFQQDLNLCPPDDLLGRGKTLSQLGNICLQRFDDAIARKTPREETLKDLMNALRYYLEALQFFPLTAIVERGITCNNIGDTFGKAGDVDEALKYYQQAIRYREQSGDIFRAAETRYNVSADLLSAGRFDDARAYVKAALTNFQSFGGRAAEHIEIAERLLARIDKAEVERRRKS